MNECPVFVVRMTWEHECLLVARAQNFICYCSIFYVFMLWSDVVLLKSILLAINVRWHLLFIYFHVILQYVTAVESGFVLIT